MAGGDRVVAVIAVVRSGSSGSMRRRRRHVMRAALVNYVLRVVLGGRGCRRLLLQALHRTVDVLARGGRSRQTRGVATSSTSRSIGRIALVSEVLWVSTGVRVLLLKVHRHGAHGASGEWRTTGNSQPLQLLLLFVLVTRRHVAILACGAVVSARHRRVSIASCHLLHSLLILERLAHQTFCLRVLEGAVSD